MELLGNALSWIVPLVAAMVAGYLSFAYWSIQQQRKERHDHSLKAIKALLAFRDEFARARNSFMTGGEVEHYRRELGYPESIREQLQGVEGSALFQQLGYEGRAFMLRKAFQECKACYLELEALLGNEYRVALHDVWKCVREYERAIKIVLHPNQLRIEPEEYARLRECIYAPIENKDDSFGARVQSHLNQEIQGLRRMLINEHGLLADFV